MRVQSIHLVIITFVYPLSLTQSQQSDPLCDASATQLYRTSFNGCSYPACTPSALEVRESPTEYRCVHDSRFCNEDQIFIPASKVLRSDRTCSCKDILGYPSLIGVCNATSTFLPMVREEDCVGGTPVYESESTDKNWVSIFWVGYTNYQQTA